MKTLIPILRITTVVFAVGLLGLYVYDRAGGNVFTLPSSKSGGWLPADLKEQGGNSESPSQPTESDRVSLPGSKSGGPSMSVGFPAQRFQDPPSDESNSPYGDPPSLAPDPSFLPGPKASFVVPPVEAGKVQPSPSLPHTTTPIVPQTNLPQTNARDNGNSNRPVLLPGSKSWAPFDGKQE